MAPEGLPDPLRVALAVVAVFERVGIPYAAAGSLASSVHGEPRSTDDLDFVADVRPAHASALVKALGEEWYVSEEAVREALASDASFNVVHLASGIKVDVFPVGRDAFDAFRVASAKSERLGNEPGELLRVDTAEHTVLRKLERFQRGGGVSERQWRDVLGVLRVQGARIDRQELARWAGPLGVSDLLHRALREAGPPP